ncbi:MAG TPA: lycopene cyclase family protein [Kofleriaceae bacterium]|nr:lycopene cyclase family protein [Kofleriaceae bacterium]
MERDRDCDVLVIGGGLAGGCMARQLVLEQPELKVIVVDRKTEFDWWIGESTITPWGDYAVRDLKLGPYLWKNHMMKHGLRFFFDDANKQLPLHQMSEIGRMSYSPFPSFQIDRALIDTDLVRMNREMGVEVLLGTSVQDIALDGEHGHVVNTSAGAIRCRWVIDAGGRQAPLVKKLDLLLDDDRHPAGAYWGRYKNCNILDQLGDDAWRKRVQNTDRYLSTTHFMYRGYWFWHIPLSENLLSIGVDFSHKFVQPGIRNAEDLTAFIRSHRCLDQILGDKAECLDFIAFKYNHRHARQYFSTDRWGLTGMSGSVIDALLSETCGGITLHNRLLNALIRVERSGDRKRFESLVKHANIAGEMRHEAIVRLYKFDRLGSFAYYMLHRQANQSNVFNTVMRESLKGSGIEGVLRMAEMHAEGCHCSTEGAIERVLDKGFYGAMERFDDELYEFLERTDSYHRWNAERFHDDADRHSISSTFWTDVDAADVEREDQLTFEAAVRFRVALMADVEGVPWSERAFTAWFDRKYTSGQRLADGVAALRAAQAAGGPPDPMVGWTPKGPVNDVDRAWNCK